MRFPLVFPSGRGSSLTLAKKPRSMFLFISRYFWAIALGTTAVNTCAAAWKAQKHIASDPSLGEGYRRMLKHYAFWMSLPWIVMGVGIVIGGIPSVFHFFRPRDGNPYVLTFHVTVICLWILSVVWIYFRGGQKCWFAILHLFVCRSRKRGQ